MSSPITGWGPGPPRGLRLGRAFERHILGNKIDILNWRKFMKSMLLILAMLFMPAGWVFPQDVPNKALNSSPGVELDLDGGLGLSGASLMNPSYNDGSPTGGQVGFGGGMG